MKPTVTVVKKSYIDTAGLLGRLRDLKQSEVLVGIPESTSPRKGDEMNNATLAYILSNGSQLHHIPARPFLEPAIIKSRQLIAKQLGLAAQACIAGDQEAVNKFLGLAGVLGSNAAKRFITDFPANGLAPNAPSTIKAKGSSTPLIKEGQLRRALTWVVKSYGNSVPKSTVTKTKYTDAGKMVEETAGEDIGISEVFLAL